MNAWLKRAAWCIATLLGLWLLAWLAVPPLLKSQAQTRLSAALGRTVTIAAVDFKPWSLELTLTDIAVASASAASAPQLQIARIHADAAISSVVRFAPVIEALEIDAPQLQIARTAVGHYDIDDLLARFAPLAQHPPPPPGEPARFALYNLRVRDAQLRFDDRPEQRVHRLEALQVALPFISNLAAQVDVKVEPHLSFKLNGAAFDSGAQATPFAQTRRGDLTLRIAGLDLAPYLGYLPDALPLRVTRGVVDGDLALQFAEATGAAPQLALRGDVHVHDFAATDAAGAPLLAWERLDLGLRDLQPLARRLGFGALKIEGAELSASRDAAGNINLLRLAAAPPGDPPAAPQATASASAAPWQIDLDRLDVVGSRVRWNDAAVKPAAAWQLDGLTVSATTLSWPVAAKVPLHVAATWHDQGNASASLGGLTIDGPVTDREARLDVALTNVQLGALAPYLAQSITPEVAGQLSATLQLDWSGDSAKPRLQLRVPHASLDGLRVRDATVGKPVDAITLKQARVGDMAIDAVSHELTIASIQLVRPAFDLRRERDGRLSPERWAVAAAPPSTASATPTPTPMPESAWQVRLKDFALEGGQVRFADASVVRDSQAGPLQVELQSLHVALQGLALAGARSTAPARLQVSGRIGAAASPPGKTLPRGLLDWKGEVGLAPLMASGQLRIERFPVHVFEPYFGAAMPVRLLNAEAGYSGSVVFHDTPDGPTLNTAGDVLIGAVHVNTLPDEATAASLAATDELLSWQALALSRVKVAVKPKALPQVEIGDAALSDFYARLVVTEQGRFNLQRAPPPGDAASAPAAAAAASAAAEAASAPTALPLSINVGATRLSRGRIDFTDHFVRPNYSAALTELNGELGPFRSGVREMATLALTGKAEGTAQLDIRGAVNPTVNPPVLDIRAKATDLELAPLSPYAGKYAGYAIERGKLSMDVAYKIDPDGHLQASNQVILNQLTFGDRIESPDATKLPVLLAVALLKDRNGVIDINLPVSGSLNDPKFSVGGIIVRVIVNLLTKAFTAPFALLSGGGGKDDLSVVEFKPGTAQLAGSGSDAIDKVAHALVERPALKMTVTGAADLASEREAYQRAALESRVLAERRREAPDASDDAALAADERQRLLKEIYRQTDLPNKPRNLIGLAKDVPAAEMEAMLMARQPVDLEQMRALALQRGTAVRDALVAKGLPSERLFLAAPKLRAADDTDAGWTPRVQLTLSPH